MATNGKGIADGSTSPGFGTEAEAAFQSLAAPAGRSYFSEAIAAS